MKIKFETKNGKAILETDNIKSCNIEPIDLTIPAHEHQKPDLKHNGTIPYGDWQLTILTEYNGDIFIFKTREDAEKVFKKIAVQVMGEKLQ